MKRLVVLLMALLVTGVIGCDGDGGGDAVGSEDPSTDVPDTGPETITLDSGTVEIDFGSTTLSSVTVTEPGTLECRFTWSGIGMYMQIVQTGILDLTRFGQSPLELDVAVNQYMVNQGGNFDIIIKHTGVDRTDVEYRIRFTPN